MVEYPSNKPRDVDDAGISRLITGESTYVSCCTNSDGGRCTGLQILSRDFAVPSEGPSNISIEDWQAWALQHPDRERRCTVPFVQGYNISSYPGINFKFSLNLASNRKLIAEGSEKFSGRG